MESKDIILITLDGKEILVNQFPYQYKKRSKIYFTIDYDKTTYNLNVKGIEPYSIKIMNNELMQKQYPENFDKILIVKNKNNEVLNSYNQKIDLTNDNVVNTITLIKMSKFQQVNKNVIKNEKQTNLITIKNKQVDSNNNITSEQFVPQILREPEIQNPQKIQKSKQLSINLMTFEERDLLKKAILSYGYDRWEYIQKIFEEKNQLGLRKKSISQIRSYTNCLIKSIADNLNFQNYDLKQLLMYLIHQPFQLPDNPKEQIIQEYNQKQNLNKEIQEDMYVCVNSRDWDLNSIRQRAKPWAKRILIMYRINNFIKDYIQYFNHKYQFQPQKFFDFFELLNFVDVNQLSGQKPSSWWSVFHDIHLLYSTYFNGYANYLHSFILKDNYKIPKTWYFYKDGKKINELGQQNQYKKLNYMNIKVDFYTEIMVLQLPNADAVTRRLKKLINIIFKLSGETQDKLQKNENLKKLFLNLQYKEIQNLIEYVKEEGIPYNINTKKFNYEELKNKVDLSIDLTGKKIQQIINLLNIIAFIILNEDIDALRKNCAFYQNEIIQQILQLFTKEKAEEYLRNNNVLYFLRSKFIPKNILQKKFNDFNLIVKKFISDDNEIYNKITIENYEKIFNELNQNGFRNINIFYKELGLENVYSLANMIFLFFEYLKPEIENLSPIISKKRKIQYLYQIKQNQQDQDENYSQDNRRKNFYQNQNIKNIQLPLQISSSLKIIKLGNLNPNPYYHTTHCLFPVGFQSVRVYYSTKFKNQKCEYFCQILQGEKKPIFKVTSEEHTEQPYISEDPSVCWNRIYEKYCLVNNKSKDNVVLSGTERFGLLDSLVINMLENLDGLDKCKRYIRKNIQVIFKNQIK